MDALKIYGGKKLSGKVKISGAKNSALPIIASTILAKNRVKIENMPNVVDIKTLLKLLGRLGANYELSGNSLEVDSSKVNSTVANYDIVKTMRASILVLGPLLTRFGHCEVSLPGGCAIGARPVDLHLKALQKMGAEITIDEGYIKASTPKDGLQGADIHFEKKSVTGTENIVMAAALAHGETNISNCALEPEVVQICEILRDAGVEIEGIGTEQIRVVGTGGKLLQFQDIKVIPDRIEAGTYLCAGAITKSTVKVSDVEPKHIQATINKLEEMNFKLEIGKDFVRIAPPEDGKIGSVDIVTAEFPKFPTDMQAQFVALTTQACSESIIEERLFENRFMHVSELQRLGAGIEIEKNQVKVSGSSELIGADVMATDLRASSALVLAGLVAKGETTIHRIYHLDRGYESLEEKLRNLGAKVERVKVDIL